MKAFTSLLAFTVAVNAHYNFPSIISGGSTTTAWEYVRQWTGYYTFDPVTSVSTDDIRCNVDGTTAFAPSILTVTAGTTVGFTANPDIYHPGPLLVYMAKVPTGYTAANWDGSGAVWFKIYQEGPIFGGTALAWPTDNAVTVSFPIPAATPNGDYLLRVEHIALHTATSAGGAQFYISCGQVTVTGGGSGTPGPLVAFPGAYSATDPGIMIDIYYPVPTSYTFPGPAVWSGGSGSGSGAGASTSVAAATKTTLTTSVKTSTSAAAATTGAVSGVTVPKYGQCGGTGWTGATVCAAGSTCTVSSQYYSQCL